jgi:hypothetical protein
MYVVPRVKRGDPPQPSKSCATMKMKMGSADDSAVCSMQLFSRLYWLLCGASGGDDRPGTEPQMYRRQFFINYFYKTILKLLYNNNINNK